MKILKEKMLEDSQLPMPSTPSYTGDPMPSTPSSTSDPVHSTPSPMVDPKPSTPSHALRSNDTYVCGIGMLVVLAIGVCVFFTYNTFQPKNKKLVNEKRDQPPKRRHLL